LLSLIVAVLFVIALWVTCHVSNLMSAPSGRMVRLPSRKQIRQKKNPYVVALGNLVIAWNTLQEQLAELFWAITELSDSTIPLAVWHSTNNDRAQRQMLRAVVDSMYSQRAVRELDSKLKAAILRKKDDITWLLNKANSLADQRNDAVHAPLWFVIDTTGSDKIGEMVPATFYGNPRAGKLVGKNLLKEFRWYKESTDVLAGYALRVRFSLGTTPFGP
jgi:hypothetical protein